MLDYCSFSTLPEDDETPNRANPVFQRLVHAWTGRAKLPMLKREQEIELIIQAQEFGCQDAMGLLVEHHLGFLVNIAGEFATKSGLDDHLDDFYSLASEAFMQSVLKFKLKRDQARLSTFAKYRVTGDCLKYVRENKYPYRFGTNLNDKMAFNQLGAIRVKFEEIHGRPMRRDFEDAVLAAQLCEVPATNIYRAISAETGTYTYSIDEIQIHAPSDAFQAEKQAMTGSRDAYLQKTIENYVDMLSERDGDIVTTVFSDPERQVDLMHVCADKHNISVERIRQIIRGARKDIRDALAGDGYRTLADIA